MSKTPQTSKGKNSAAQTFNISGNNGASGSQRNGTPFTQGGEKSIVPISPIMRKSS